MNDIDEMFAGQLDREDLKGMTHEQINKARDAGQLDSMMRYPNWVRPGKLEQRMAIAEAEDRYDALKKAHLSLKLQNDPEAVIREVMNSDETKQLTRDDLATMTHEQINEARDAGRLNKVLGLN
ncbi:hypothetical protein [Streptosporangium sp. V21-05]|uniref:hypothetical protein n=1 Tax=Streptosporangium sp. V21-05 TaxID=3446115 RepID=UPI003F535C43